MEPEAVPLVAKQVCRMLVERRFRELVTASAGRHLSAEEIKEAVDDVGVPLVMPPERMWEELDAVADGPGRFNVVFDLWTAAGPCDRSVELTLYSQGERPVFELDHIGAS